MFAFHTYLHYGVRISSTDGCQHISQLFSGWSSTVWYVADCKLISCNLTHVPLGIYASIYAGTLYIYRKTEKTIHIIAAYRLSCPTVSRMTSPSFYIISSITSLFVLNGVRTICDWITVIGVMRMSNHRQNPLATSYLFLVYYGFWPGEISHICSYFITVIADGLMASLFLSYSISNWLMSLRYGGATKCGEIHGV